MSFLRMILVGSYLAGAVGLFWAIALRVGLHIGDFTPRGALGFAAVCFLCTLATREVAAVIEKPKEEAKPQSTAA